MPYRFWFDDDEDDDDDDDDDDDVVTPYRFWFEDRVSGEALPRRVTRALVRLCATLSQACLMSAGKMRI